MNELIRSLRRLVEVAWGHHGERILQVGLISYLAGHLVPFLAAFFLGYPPLTLFLALLPVTTLVLFLIEGGYSGFVALFSTMEEGRRVFKALLTALAAQVFTGLILALIPIHQSRFAAAVGTVSVLVIVGLHFGNEQEPFAKFMMRQAKRIAVIAVLAILAAVLLPGTLDWVGYAFTGDPVKINKSAQRGGIDKAMTAAIVSAVEGRPRASRRSAWTPHKEALVRLQPGETRTYTLRAGENTPWVNTLAAPQGYWSLLRGSVRVHFIDGAVVEDDGSSMIDVGTRKGTFWVLAMEPTEVLVGATTK